MEIYTPNELRKKFKDPWVAPYKKIITMVDDQIVELVEYHPCISGSEWMIYQYKRTSNLVLDAYRDGNKHVYIVKVGKEKLNLKASFSAAGIEEVNVKDDEVRIVHAGLAGAGVGAAICRGMAEGVKRIEIYSLGGGSKLGKAAVITPLMKKIVIGIDDTDTKEQGATWTLAHNLGTKLKEKGYEYIDHVIVQLYPKNPNKTQNCVAVALTFAVRPGMEEKLVNNAVKFLEKATLSDNTAIAVFEGIKIPEELIKYSIKAKTKWYL